MTPDERNMLNDLAQKVSQMPSPQRDPEAEDLIRTKIGSRPDALYLMTQTVIVQNLALQRAQQQLQDLQARVGQNQPGQVSRGSSWLGQGSSNADGGFAGQGQYSAPPPPQYAGSAGGFGGGGSSFLRGAAQTAAGVAAGTLAAEAIGSMFSHHGGSGFFGGGNEFMGSGMAPTEETVNNYYDNPGGNADYQGSDYGGGDDRSSNFADASGSDDGGQYSDNAQFDDNVQFDDSGSDFGDGGGFDSGSDDSLV